MFYGRERVGEAVGVSLKGEGGGVVLFRGGGGVVVPFTNRMATSSIRERERVPIPYVVLVTKLLGIVRSVSSGIPVLSSAV